MVEAARHPLDPLPEPGLAGASNAFAATGARAAAGKPLLATDPHLALSAPSIWMLARLDLESGPVIGGTIPGIPAVLVGRSDALAWGLTSSYLDDQDIFIERLDPDDPGRYLTPRGWRRFETREATIAVKDAEPVACQPALEPARAGDPRRRVRRGGGHAARPRRGAGLDRPQRRGPLGRGGDRADARALDRRGARRDQRPPARRR